MPSSRRLVVTGLLWISFQSAATTASAQIPPTGARAVALGGAVVGLEGEDGGRQNPAALSGLGRASVSFGFSRLFGIPELDGRSINVAAPAGDRVLSFGLIGFGFETFSETELSAGLAGTVKGLATGLRLRYVRRRFDRYGTNNRFELDAGWMYTPAPGLVLGTSIRNLGVGSDGVEVAAGLTGRRTGRLLVAASVVMKRGTTADVRFGFEMQLVNAFVLRLGGSTSPELMTAGLGLIEKRLSIDLSVALHARLGLTPVITIRFVR